MDHRKALEQFREVKQRLERNVTNGLLPVLNKRTVIEDKQTDRQTDSNRTSPERTPKKAKRGARLGRRGRPALGDEASAQQPTGAVCCCRAFP